MSKRNFFISFIILSNLSFPVLALEVDSFTGRFNQMAALQDSAQILNLFTNKQMQKAMEKANLQGHCSVRALYLELWNNLAHHPIGVVEHFAEKSPNVSHYLVESKKSVYAGAPTFLNERRLPQIADMFILTGWFGPVIKLEGQLIGTDKLGHFFSEGWGYFLKGNLRDALLYGVQDEFGMDGAIGSGVFSYADLSTNYDGLRFWRQILDGHNPYFICENSKFLQVRNFDWLNYVSASWDEGINCSTFSNLSMNNSVKGRVEKLGLSCPVAPKACGEIVDDPCAVFYVNPGCYKVAGVNVAAKALACFEKFKTENWNTPAENGLTKFDLRKIDGDRILGVLGLPFHFLLAH